MCGSGIGDFLIPKVKSQKINLFKYFHIADYGIQSFKKFQKWGNIQGASIDFLNKIIYNN